MMWFLGVVEFVRDLLGILGCTLGVVEFVRDRWVHWGAPCRTSGSVAVARLIEVRPGGRRIRSGWLGSLLCTLWKVGFVLDRWVRPGSLRDHSG